MAVLHSFAVTGPWKTIMASTGGRAPPGQEMPTPPKDLIGLAQLAVPPFQCLDPVPLLGHRRSPLAAVSLGLPHPTSKRLQRAADLRHDRADRCPLRAMFSGAVQHQTHRSITNLKRVVCRRLLRRHRSILSTVEASGKPGAVQTRGWERRWLVLAEVGRHVWLGRARDPEEVEIREAEASLAARSLAVWLAVAEGDVGVHHPAA
jgi:hypothetical protein